MTKDEYKLACEKDSYLIDRKPISEPEIRLHLKEVDFHCPLCGKVLQSHNQKKFNKKFEIAHIYPNRPKFEQYINLNHLERLGENSESFENKIALCKDCHSEYDHHTTKDEYLKLVEKKKQLNNLIDMSEILDTIDIDRSIKTVINKLKQIEVEEDDNIELNYNPVEIDNKIKDYSIFRKKIKNNVLTYFPLVRDIFKEVVGDDNDYEIISIEIKKAYIKIKKMSEKQELIFSKMVEWLKNKTQELTNDVCEIIISYFVQNCEVFDEITK